MISLIAFAVCTVARERFIPQEEFHFVGVVSTRGASRSQHKSTNCLRFCEASLLRTYTSQNKYYRVHVQNKVTSNTRFQFTAIKDSWAHGARGLNPGAISSLPVFFEPGLARAALVDQILASNSDDRFC